jgi:tetratricopeptide (TPR) repeat protein
LAGAVAESSGNLNDAIFHYQKGVEFEEAMIYNEPKDWTLPVRHYLGNALLKAKKYTEAEVVFTEDLRINPLNGWALTGLHQAQAQQRKTTQAAATAASLKKAFSGKDVEITAPVF